LGKNKIYSLAIGRWGLDMQVNVLFEEMAELTKVLCKLYRSFDIDKIDELSEEIADVEIMLEQMKYAFKCSEKVKKYKKKKLNRLRKLLKMNNGSDKYEPK